MKHYQEVVLSNLTGLPVNGASVTVRVAAVPIGSGALATIYSDEGITTKANPVTTNALGRFDFYVADGRYDLTFTSPFITTYSLSDLEISDVSNAQSGDVVWKVANLNNILFVDGVKYAQTAAGLQQAIDDASSASEGVAKIVFLPTGTLTTNVQIVVKENVILRCAGPRNSVIKAGASFPTGTALIRLGDVGKTIVHSTRIEDCLLNLNGVAGSIGIYSNSINEQSGARNVVIREYTSRGILIDNASSGAPANFLLEHLELFHATGATTAEGIRISNTASGRGRVDYLSVVPIDGATASVAGVRVINSIVDVTRMHGESMADGVLFDGAGAQGSVSYFHGNLTTGDNAVRLAAGASDVVLFSIEGNADMLQNDVTSRTLTSAAMNNTLHFYSFSPTTSNPEFWIDNTGMNIAGQGILVQGPQQIRSKNAAGTVDTRFGAEAFSISQGALGTLSNHPFKFYTNNIEAGSFDTSQFLNTKRIKASLGTALVAGDFALSAGWGTTASVGTITGTDQAAQFTVTSNGTGQAANPTVTLTFKDGTWTNAPVLATTRADTNSPTTGFWSVTSVTATQAVFTFVGLPVATTTYSMAFVAMGR